jgi:hypothetical protein
MSVLQDTVPAVNTLQAPESIEIVPAPGPDGLVHGVDGRKVRIRDPHAVVAAANARGRDFLLDIDHRSTESSTEAAAWLFPFEVHADGSIWGVVKQWVQPELVTSGRYRSVSPEFLVSHSADGVSDVISLEAVALTNRPNLTVRSVHKEEPKMPDQTPMVPKADYDLVLARLAQLEQDAKQAHSARVEAVVDAAIAAGSIAPASKAYHMTACKDAAGLAAFSAMVAALPATSLATPTAPVKAKHSRKQATADEVEAAIARNTGVSIATYRQVRDRIGDGSVCPIDDDDERIAGQAASGEESED